MRTPGRPVLGPAGENALDPLRRHGIASVDRTEQRTGNRDARVGVAAAHDGVNHALFETGGTAELPQGITERVLHPALVGHETARGRIRRSLDGIEQGRLHWHRLRLLQVRTVERVRRTSGAHGARDGAAKTAFACRQTRWGWVTAASRSTHRATCSASNRAPKTPRGLTRMSAPFAWISGSRSAARVFSTMPPMSNGSDSNQRWILASASRKRPCGRPSVFHSGSMATLSRPHLSSRCGTGSGQRLTHRRSCGTAAHRVAPGRNTLTARTARQASRGPWSSPG